MPRCNLIDRAVGNDDTIVSFRIFNGDQTVEHIDQHLLRVPLARITKTAATRQPEAESRRAAARSDVPSAGSAGPTAN